MYCDFPQDNNLCNKRTKIVYIPLISRFLFELSFIFLGCVSCRAENKVLLSIVIVLNVIELFLVIISCIMNIVFDISNLYDGLKYIIPWKITLQILLFNLSWYKVRNIDKMAILHMIIRVCFKSIRSWVNTLSTSVCALYKDNMIMGSMLDQHKESLWH